MALPLGEALVALWLLAVATSRVDAVTTTTTCEPPKLRLSGGASGRLEVRYCGVWGTVCDDHFGTADARVVCRELGYVNSSGIRIRVSSGTGPIWLDNLGCSGTEMRLADCSHNGWGDHNCGHSEDVGVNCELEGSDGCSEGQLRLSDHSCGRLEVCHMGLWGTVCDDYFDDVDAGVVCHQLGYDTGSVNHEVDPGHTHAPIWLDGLHCSGAESRLVDCVHNGWGDHNCYHFEDVGVSCEDMCHIVLNLSVTCGKIPLVVLCTSCSGAVFLCILVRKCGGRARACLRKASARAAASRAAASSALRRDVVTPPPSLNFQVVIGNVNPLLDVGRSLSKVTDPVMFGLLQQLLEVPLESRTSVGKGRDAGHYHKTYSRFQLEGAWEINMGIKKNYYDVRREEIRAECSLIQACAPNVHRTAPTPALTDRVGEQLSMDSSVNEKLLLHGTKVKNVEVILNHGLDERCTRVAAFGFGVYFAEDPAKSDHYAEADLSSDCSEEARRLHQELYGPDHPGEVFYVLACQVLLGCPVYSNGTPSDKPLSVEGPTPSCPAGLEVFTHSRHNQLVGIPGTPSISYHSLVIEKGTASAVKRHREFVIFEAKTQVLPKFLLAYSRR